MFVLCLGTKCSVGSPRQVHLREREELHSTPLPTSAAEETQESVVFPIPGQPHPAVGNNTLPLPKGSDRTLKCPGRHPLVPFTPCRSTLVPPPTSDLAWVADDNTKLLRETLWTSQVFPNCLPHVSGSSVQEAAAILYSSMVTGRKSCRDE